MKAVVYQGPGRVALAETPQPALTALTDAIVRVTRTTICGTDLAILGGGVPTVETGRIIGHEAVGVVESVGAAVRKFRPGDRVLISCITSCGSCEYCRRGIPSNCVEGGWILGNTIDGCQAEYVRAPFADNGLHLIPPALDDETALMLCDIIPTGLEVGVMNGDVQFGDVVAIIGAGPVGLAALLTAQFFSPAAIYVVDVDAHRLALAEELGATKTINNRDNGAAVELLALTNGRGADAVIEAVGHPLTCKLAQEVIGVGGTIANVGVYSQSAELHKETLWTKNVTLRMGVVNTNTTPLLLNTIVSGALAPERLITHRLPFAEIERAYKIFANAAHEKAVKVVLQVSEATAVAAQDRELVSAIARQVMTRLAQNAGTTS